MVKARIDATNYPFCKAVIYEEIAHPKLLFNPFGIRYLVSIGADGLEWEGDRAFVRIPLEYVDYGMGKGGDWDSVAEKAETKSEV